MTDLRTVAGAGGNAPSSPEVAAWPKKRPAANAEGADLAARALTQPRPVRLPAAAMLGDPAIKGAGRGFRGLLFLAERLVGADRLRHAEVPHLAEARAFPADDAVGRGVRRRGGESGGSHRSGRGRGEHQFAIHRFISCPSFLVKGATASERSRGATPGRAERRRRRTRGGPGRRVHSRPGDRLCARSKAGSVVLALLVSFW